MEYEGDGVTVARVDFDFVFLLLRWSVVFGSWEDPRQKGQSNGDATSDSLAEAGKMVKREGISMCDRILYKVSKINHKIR